MKNLLTFRDHTCGIQEVFLNIKATFPEQRKREQFEERLSKFFNSDPVHSKIFRRIDDFLVYQTECIIPKKQDARPPVLLLFGNPASHSIYSGMFFSSEGKNREHRFWKSLNKTGFLSFESEFKGGPNTRSTSLSKRNQLRKEELYNLSYNSPFRIGLAVFYSMPSSASGSPWVGVAGLYRLFGRVALQKIGEHEKDRIEKLIRQFISPEGAVVAFQKDAYLKIKSLTSPNYNITGAREGKLVGSCQCDSSVKLFCFPPTRLMQGKRMLSLIRDFKRNILSEEDESEKGELYKG